MKKSIKYAGIAAATLLAVAPVAAPVVSNATTTVKAADTDDNTSAMTDFTNQYTDYTVPTSQTVNKITTFGKNQTLANFDKDYAQFVKYGLTDHAAKAATLSDTADGSAAATVNISAVTSNGTTVNDATELSNYLTDNTTKAVTVTATFNYKDTDGNNAASITKKFTITKDAVASDKITSAAVTYNKSTNVEYGSSTADYRLVDSSNVSVKDNNGDELVGAKNGLTKAVGSQFYTSYNEAFNAATSGSMGTATPTTFEKADTTYYQVIKLSFAKDSAFATFLTNHATDGDNYGLTVNGTTPTGNYNDQTTFQTGTDTNGKFVTVIRSFNVGSKEAANWTTEDVDGVVTTKNDAAYYTVNNNDNATVANRALAKNTAWKTDKKRTDSNGNVQYRVATGEWINANDVTYAAAGSTSTGALTDIQKVTGTVSLEDAAHVYFVYNKAGEQVQNRALAGNTAWKVINTAKDANGVTMYRVATDEWVMAGTGVSFK